MNKVQKEDRVFLKIIYIS